MKKRVITAIILAVILIALLSVGTFADYYKDGVYYKSAPDASGIITTELIIVAVSCVVGLTVVLSMKKKHAPPKTGTSARGNLKGRSFALTSCRDTFMYSRQSRTPRQTEQNNPHRGGPRPR